MQKNVRHQIVIASAGTAPWPFLIAKPLNLPSYATLPLICLTSLYFLLTVALFVARRNTNFERSKLWLNYVSTFLLASAILLVLQLGIGKPLKKWIPQAPKAMFILALVLDTGLVIPMISRYNRLPIAEEKRKRGRSLTTAETAKAIAQADCTPEDNPIMFGGISYALSSLGPHFLVVGTTGSGKSLTLRMMLQSIVPTLLPGSDRRLLIFDAKGDMLSILAGMHPKIPVKSLNVFDERCVKWHMAADLATPAMAVELAAILVPEAKGGKNDFFKNSARCILAEVVKVFQVTAPGAWELADILRVCTHETRLRTVLNQTDASRTFLESYKRPELLHDILSTLQAELGRYSVIASLWQHAKETISLKTWMESEAILVMNMDADVESQMIDLNRLIIKRLSQLIRGQADSKTRKSYLILDEIRLLGKCEGLYQAMLLGRSKGLHVVLAYQDHEGFCEEYGPRVGNEMANQCANVACMRLDSPKTAEYISQRIGEGEFIEDTESRMINPMAQAHERENRTLGRQRVKRAVVLPSELSGIPEPTVETGLTGYYIVPKVGVYQHTYFPDLTPGDENVPEFLPRPVNQQYLKAWDDVSDYARLGCCDHPQASEPEQAAEPLPSPKPKPNPKQKRKRSLKDVKRHNDGLLES